MHKTVAPQLARQINNRIVLDLLLARGPLTRTQIRQVTGMSQPSTAELIDRLQGDQLIEAVGTSGQGRRGPMAQLYGIRGDRSHVVTARINAQEVNAAVADLAGSIVAQTVRPVGDSTQPAKELLTAMRQVTQDAGVNMTSAHNIVIGTPGSVNPVTGDVNYVAEHPEWRANVRDPLEQQLGVPVRLENQMNLAGLAEQSHGAGRGLSSFALLSIGPGVAVALVLGGQLWRGASGGAGELAYLPAAGAPVTSIDPDSNTMSGGYAEMISQRALLKLADEHGLAGATPADIVKDCLARNDADDPYLTEFSRRIAVAIAAICSVVDPGVLVLTGTVGSVGAEVLADQVSSALTSMSPLPTQILPSAVSGDPVIRGCVTIALEDAHNELWGPRVTA